MLQGVFHRAFPGQRCSVDRVVFICKNSANSVAGVIPKFLALEMRGQGVGVRGSYQNKSHQRKKLKLNMTKTKTKLYKNKREHYFQSPELITN